MKVSNIELPAFIIVSPDDIAKRAYEIYVERGRTDGFDREDWRRAEYELKTPPAIPVLDPTQRKKKKGAG